jgi:predicted RND superfamily exporter protein
MFGYFALRLEVDPNVESLLPENAQVRKLMEIYKTQGLSGEYLLLAVRSENPFDLEKLAVYYRVLERLEQLPELERGVTPFNLITFQKKGTRPVPVPVAPEMRAPQTPEELALFREQLTGTPYAENLVISRDGTVLNAIFPARHIADFKALMGKVKAITSELDGVYTYYLSGSVPFVERTGTYLSGDLARLSLFAGLAILLFYFLGFRTVRGVLLPFLVVALGTLWSVGFMALLGFSLSIVTIAVPPLVLTLGSSYSIHILNQYYRTSAQAHKDRYWIVGAVEKIDRTVLLAALTTIAGFLGLLSTSIRQTREFALTASFGIAASALLSLFLLPAMLSRLPAPRASQVHRVRAGALSRAMVKLGPFVLRWRLPIAAALLVIAAGFGVAISHISTNTDTIGYFPRQDKVVRDMYALTGKLGGFDEVNLTVTAPGKQPGYFLQPEPLQQVSALEQKLKEDPDVSYAVGFTTYLRFMNQVMDGRNEIPQSRAMILLLSRLLRSVGSSQAVSLSNEDFSQLTLSLRVYNSSTGKFIDESGLRNLLARIDATASSSLPPAIGRQTWGMSVQYLMLSNLLRSNLLRSMLLSVLLVLLIGVVGFRSLRYGLLTIVPLVTGVLLNFVLMAVVAIPLDMTTIMVSSVAVGVGVDDAIHLILHYRGRRKLEPRDADKTLAETVGVTGRPILLTTLSIVAGLLVLTLASFRPVVYFGLLLVFALSATCASTLTVLPALISLSRRRRTAS